LKNDPEKKGLVNGTRTDRGSLRKLALCGNGQAESKPLGVGRGSRGSLPFSSGLADFLLPLPGAFGP